MVSWYHRTDARPTKGARISVVDVSDLSRPRYRHLLLVDPVETAEGADFGPAEYDSGGAEFARLRQADRDHQIEQVGAELRAAMPFLNPVTVRAGQAQAAASGGTQGSSH